MPSLTRSLFLITVGLPLVGGLLSFILHRKPKLSIIMGFTCANISSLSGMGLGIMVLLTGSPAHFNLPWSLLNVPLGFTIGPLAAFFITVICVVCFSVSVYSYGYVTEYIGKHNIGFLGLLYNLFVFSMITLVASENALMFLFFWELMSLSSYFLVVYDHHDPNIRKAGFIYIVMTHIGTLFIVAAFMLLYKYAGSFNFLLYAAAGHALPSQLKTIVFLLITLGFGTKAGIVPLHIWLPRAHPAAPSNVSAIMSGVMIKTAIYGFIKVVIEMMGGGPVWWGVLILVIGSISAVLGVMYALMEHDIKRLFAYSSVENIGIILIGLGASLIFIGNGNNKMAMVGLTAALFHVFNHAIFKGLLFLGAGSVHFATRTRDIEKLGGLLKKMPWTGFFFLIGAISISAIPPFNGFVSEWLTFQSLLMLGSGSTSTLLNILGPLSGAALALTGALAAACFVKAFGIQFLALPRSANAESAREVPVSMRLAMGLLALLCFVIGVAPLIVISLLNPVCKALLGVGTTQILGGYGWVNVLTKMKPVTGISPISLVIILAAAVFLIFFVFRVIGKSGTVRTDETWNCGMVLSPNMEYSATSFSKPILIIFRKIFQPKREIQKEYILEPYFTRVIKYRGSIKPVFEETIYGPITQILIRIANRIKIFQSGSIHLYLAYIFVVLVLLLIFAR
ncbi:hydrogenase 4 subunit B [Phosphitispora sp. TUW77]|uniref:hydrogenase 4 subunit B n=1 Tax=Phosphitispora sp. TUW77 TaxID=3152361 RepID=UPI003AB7FDCF